MSENKQAIRLLLITDLGDQVPSEAMDNMLIRGYTEKRGPTSSSTFLYVCPPMTVRHALAASKTMDLQTFASEVDWLMVDAEDHTLLAVLVHNEFAPSLPRSPPPTTDAGAGQHSDPKESQHPAIPLPGGIPL